MVIILFCPLRSTVAMEACTTWTPSVSTGHIRPTIRTTQGHSVSMPSAWTWTAIAATSYPSVSLNESTNIMKYKKNQEREIFMTGEICSDNRFEVIERAKQDLIKRTNIETSPQEMMCLDDFLFRCWQMGWLEKYNNVEKPIQQ